MNSHPHPICFVVWVKPTLLGVDTHGGRFKLLTSQFKILYFHYTRHLENSIVQRTYKSYLLWN